MGWSDSDAGSDNRSSWGALVGFVLDGGSSAGAEARSSAGVADAIVVDVESIDQERFQNNLLYYLHGVIHTAGKSEGGLALHQAYQISKQISRSTISTS